MSYTSSKTDWDEDYELTTGEQNRIEGNIKAIAEETITIAGDKTLTGDNTFSGANTFQANITFSGAGIVGLDNITARGSTSRIEPNFLHGTYTGGTLFTTLSAYLPNIGDEMIVSGGIANGGASVILSYAKRYNTSNIRLYGIYVPTGVEAINSITSGSSQSFSISMAW